MDNEAEGRPGNPRLLAAVAWQGAALASPLPVLLFRREEIAERLDRLGAVTGEAALLGAVALVAALAVPWLRDKLPAGAMLMLGGLVAAAGLGLMAWTVELTLFTIGGVLLAVGAAPGMVTQRILLATDARPADRFRTMSLYWGAVATGAYWPLLVRIFSPVGYGTMLWISSVLMLVGALMVGRHALAHDEDQEVEVAVARPDVPWARRSYGAAFAVGAVVIGGADAAQSLLLGEWQRSAAQNAAVLSVGAGAAALICLFGPWYHRLHRLGGSRRSDAIGTQLLVAGALVLLGGLSFTYIGLVVCWLFAGGAIALAASGLDAAVLPIAGPRDSTGGGRPAGALGRSGRVDRVAGQCPCHRSMVGPVEDRMAGAAPASCRLGDSPLRSLGARCRNGSGPSPGHHCAPAGLWHRLPCTAALG